MTELYDYQKKGVRKLGHFKGRSLLADEQGLGKSIQSLTWADENDAYPLVIICKAGLMKDNWESEVHTHLRRRAVILNGRKPPRGVLLKTSKIWIINYDILGPWIPFLNKQNPKCIIIDECHALGNRKSQRTKNVKRFCKKKKHIICCSGTPLTHKHLELYPTLNILRPDKFKSFLPYAFRYCKPRRTPWGYQFNGSDNAAELRKILLSTCMIRRLKKDVLWDLPEKMVLTFPMEITDRKQYDRAMSDFMGWLKKKVGVGKARRAASAEALVKTNYIKQLISDLKKKSVIEWIDSFLQESDGKILVFGIHKKILRELHEHYKDISVLINGDVSQAKRKIRVHAFNKNKKIRIFFANMKAAGEGLNLVSANTVAFIEMGWHPAVHQQAIDRAHRIGQTKQVTAYFLIARNTIEEDLCKLIQDRQQTLDSILDGGDGGSDFDIFDKFLKRISRRAA